VVKTKQGEPKIYADKFIYGLSNHTGTVLLESKRALPLVYTQTQQFSAKTFAKLAVTDREQALLQGAMTTTKAKNVKTVTPTAKSENVAYTAQLDDTTMLDSTDKVIIYRNQHASGSSNNLLSKLPADTIILTPEQRKSLTPATGMTKPSQHLLNLITANQEIFNNDAEVNKNGLKQMTSDMQGHQLPYNLTITNPKKYRNTELYLVLDGITYNNSSIKYAMTVGNRNSVFAARPNTKIDKLNRLRDGLKGNLSASGYSLTAQTMDNLATFNQLGTTNMSDYEPRTSAVINLGYSKHAREKIVLNFTQVRDLKFKSAKLVAVPFGKSYTAQTTELQKQGLQNMRVTANQVTGTTKTTQASVLTTSIPYSTGWHLQVDGKSVKTQIVNDAFVGAALAAGKHTIKLTYTTPGLKLGTWLAAVSWLIVIVIAGWLGVKRFMVKKD